MTIKEVLLLKRRMVQWSKNGVLIKCLKIKSSARCKTYSSSFKKTSHDGINLAQSDGANHVVAEFVCAVLVHGSDTHVLDRISQSAEDWKVRRVECAVKLYLMFVPISISDEVNVAGVWVTSCQDWYIKFITPTWFALPLRPSVYQCWNKIINSTYSN